MCAIINGKISVKEGLTRRSKRFNDYLILHRSATEDITQLRTVNTTKRIV